MVRGAPARAERWPTPPARWLLEARCIASGIDIRTGRPIVLANGARFWGESGGNVADTGNPINRGLYQIAWDTWRSVGGIGDPARAGRAEQSYRAWLIWRRDGGSWREWSTASTCGLR